MRNGEEGANNALFSKAEDWRQTGKNRRTTFLRLTLAQIPRVEAPRARVWGPIARHLLANDAETTLPVSDASTPPQEPIRVPAIVPATPA